MIKLRCADIQSVAAQVFLLNDLLQKEIELSVQLATAFALDLKCHAQTLMQQRSLTVGLSLTQLEAELLLKVCYSRLQVAEVVACLTADKASRRALSMSLECKQADTIEVGVRHCMSSSATISNSANMRMLIVTMTNIAMTKKRFNQAHLRLT